ncbi:hypothetical protein ISP15_08605 [Dyella jejuensis]|uniref:Uncharacterized protein n=1 Tax=Dyella jejuensis TaxID=1432009 RepID=A0ABW8JH25_9GAMM
MYGKPLIALKRVAKNALHAVVAPHAVAACHAKERGKGWRYAKEKSVSLAEWAGNE